MSDIDKWLAVPVAAGYRPLPSRAQILDLGCGDGSAVHELRKLGYEAFGCDFEIAPGSHRSAGRLRAIEKPYRLPFDDATFDAVVSQEVLEHVQNYRETFREIRRVLRLGGVSVHVFPSRWRPIEAHVFVPFASVFRPYWWLLAWALVGVRNQYQRGVGPRKVAGRNYLYLRSHTNYLTRRANRPLCARAVRHVPLLRT